MAGAAPAVSTARRRLLGIHRVAGAGRLARGCFHAGPPRLPVIPKGVRGHPLGQFSQLHMKLLQHSANLVDPGIQILEVNLEIA